MSFRGTDGSKNSSGVLIKAFVGEVGATRHVKTQKIGVDLFADAQVCRHKRNPKLSAKQSQRLQKYAERKGVSDVEMSGGEPDQRSKAQ